MEATAQVAVAQVAHTNVFQDFAIFLQEGGAFTYIIVIVFFIGLAIVFERGKTLWKADTDGNNLMLLIKKHVLNNQVEEAIRLCSSTTAFLPKVLKSGLKRANQSKEQIKDAIETTILEVLPRLEKRMGHIALLANVSTLFGLLGTIHGLITSFGAVANADPATKARLLASGIATAMHATLLGLISSIVLMLIYSILSSKSEKIMAEIEENSAKLVDMLGSRKSHYTNDNDNQAA